MTGHSRVAIAAVSCLVLGSVAVLPDALNRFVFVKLALVLLGSALAFLAPARGAIPRPVVILGGAAAAWLAVSALLGDQPLVQVIGRAPRYEGVVALGTYAAAAFAGARLLGPERTPWDERVFVRALSIAAVAVGAIAALEALGLRPLPADTSRPGSLLGNASEQGAWALLALGVLAAAALHTQDRWAYLGTAAAATALATSGSRGAYVGALGLALVLVLGASRRQRAFVLGGVAAGAATVLLLPAAQSRVLGESALAQATVAGRQRLWAETLSLASSRPWTGVGPNGFADAVVGVHSADWYRIVGPQFPPDSPHSWPLQVAMAGGVVLVGLVVALLAVGGASAWRQVRSGGHTWLEWGAAAGLAGYGLALLFHFTSPGTTPVAALLAGALVAARPGGASVRRDRVVAALLGVSAAVMVTSALAEIPLRTAIERLSGGDLESGDKAFEVARTLRPWDVEVCATAAHAYAVLAVDTAPAAGQYAARWLDCAAPRLSRSVGLMEDQAAVAEAAGDLAGAATALGRALSRDPVNPNLHLTRGVVQAKAGDLTAAEASFLRAADLAPYSADPWTNLQTLYRQAGNDAKAEEAARRAAAASADRR